MQTTDISSFTEMLTHYLPITIPGNYIEKDFSVTKLEKLISEIDVIERIYLIIRLFNYERPQQWPLLLTEARKIFDQLTTEEILANSTACHPILHEACHQYSHDYELVKLMWAHPVFRPFWNNAEYRDKYHNTVFQRLASRLIDGAHHESNYHFIKWVRNNMHIAPAKKYARKSPVYPYELIPFYNPGKFEIASAHILDLYNIVDDFIEAAKSNDAAKKKDLIEAAAKTCAQLCDSDLLADNELRMPILHVICENIKYTFELFQSLYFSSALRVFWNNPLYVIQYGDYYTENMTAMELLSTKMETDMNSTQIEWVNINCQ